MPRGNGLQALKLRRDLGLREQALLRGLDLLIFTLASATNDDLVFLRIVLVKEGLFVVNRAGYDFHLHCVLLGGLLHLFQVLVIAVLSKPADNVSVRPVDLQRVGVLVVDMVLKHNVSSLLLIGGCDTLTSMGI